jgi:hypothetical protein
MRFRKQALVMVFIAFIMTFAFSGEHQSLAQLYRTGKVRFVRELALDEKTMPKDVLFVGPSGVECDTAGKVYVLDFPDNNIKVFDPAGKFLRIIGRKGQGPGEFNMPAGLVVTGDRLIVRDIGNRRICALTLSGEYMKTESYAAFSGIPQHLGALPDGKIVLETEKTYFAETDRPQDVALEILAPDLKPTKKIYSHPVLRDKYRNGDSGSFNIPQPYCPDVYWDVSPSGEFAIGFSEKYEIGVYGKDGAKISSFTRPYDPVKVTAEDQKNFFDAMGVSDGTGFRSGAPDYIVKNTTFPKFKPAFDALLVDSDGNILVHPYRKDKKDMNRYFDAFDPTGIFIATVRVEGDIPFPFDKQKSRIVNGCLWVAERGGDEMPHVVKYRISE